jgi:hypothetical protein
MNARIMLIERLLGIVPPLTRDSTARMAQMQSQQSAKA